MSNTPKKPKQPFTLRQAFAHLQAGLLHNLGASNIAFHPTAKGDNAELNWLKMLRRFLPKRYQVDQAFVVDVNDNVSQQLDIVIYDAQYSPLLFKHQGGLYIPAESVYAGFEVKPELDKDNIEYAGEKIASVRRLERTSAKVIHAGGEHEAVVPKPIIGGLLATGSSWTPPFGAAFEGALKARGEQDRVDLGCALAHGAFEQAASEDGGALTVREGDDALVFFALQLFHRLQRMGTVPAIDIKRWGSAGFD